MSLLDVGTSTTQHQPASVTPRAAYVLSDYAGAGERGTVITEHPVRLHQGQLQVQAGKLLDAASLANVLASFTAESDGWLPAHLLYQTRSRFAWLVPGTFCPMAFTVNKTDRRTLMVAWPHLVLIARDDGRLQVLAIAGDAGAVAGTHVYHAPLMNLGDRGELCFGNATRPPFDLASIPGYEDALFRTRFTHVNHPGTFTAGRGLGARIGNKLHLELWQALHDQRVAEFPPELLRAMRDGRGNHMKLEEVISA